MTRPAVDAQTAIQTARARGCPTNGTPVTIWWANASASPM